jgi:glutamate racemase
MLDPHFRPIGVFDSGIGGLTVLKTLMQEFPEENFVYLGDTARIPYGSKSLQTIEKYLIQNLCYMEKWQVKAIVIACNSASSAISEALLTADPLLDASGKRSRFTFKKLLNSNQDTKNSIIVYDTIRPGAKAAASATQNNRIGVIGTRATIHRRAYIEEIHKLNIEAQIFQQACPLLVPLVEEGWDDDPVTNLITYRYLSPLLASKIDTLIMGCTHYPLLRKAFEKVLGPHVQLIDSGKSIADEMNKDFESGLLLVNTQPNKGEVKLLTTDISSNYDALAMRIISTQNFERVDIM